MSSDEAENIIEDRLYEVEEILERKIKKGKLYYSVKWVGYESSLNTWEPREHLPEEMVNDFEENFKKKKKDKKEKLCKSLLKISMQKARETRGYYTIISKL